jgi:hypothetical protein
MNGITRLQKNLFCLGLFLCSNPLRAKTFAKYVTSPVDKAERATA